MTMRSLSAGIDIGTTHAKAVLLSPDGEIVAQFRASYKPKQGPGGMHELDADEVFNAVIGVLKECFATKEGVDIAAVCFSAAMHGLMVVDEDGQPLTGVMTWADTRSKYEALELKQSAIGESLYHATGTPIHPMSPLSKLLWLRKHEPAIWDRQPNSFLSRNTLSLN